VMSSNTGWICPKCETGVAPTQKVCPNCDTSNRHDKEKTQDPEIKAAKKALEEADKSPAPNDKPFQKWIDQWPGYKLTPKDDKCAFDGLPPGTHSLACFCRKCSQYSLLTTWK
jgi:hypothetical protein